VRNVLFIEIIIRVGRVFRPVAGQLALDLRCQRLFKDLYGADYKLIDVKLNHWCAFKICTGSSRKLPPCIRLKNWFAMCDGRSSILHYGR